MKIKSHFSRISTDTQQPVWRERLANGQNGRHDNNIEFEPAVSTAARSGNGWIVFFRTAQHMTINFFRSYFTLFLPLHASLDRTHIPSKPNDGENFLRPHSSSPCVELKRVEINWSARRSSNLRLHRILNVLWLYNNLMIARVLYNSFCEITRATDTFLANSICTWGSAPLDLDMHLSPFGIRKIIFEFELDSKSKWP